MLDAKHMIGSLKGKVLFKEGLRLIIDVSGVGYRVQVSQKIWAKSKIKDEISLYTYTHVKEEALELFGFEDPSDLRLFENLITVPGVGPKTAMSVFSFSDRDGIINAVMKGDVDFFTAVPRLGRKNAQKIIIELKNKFGDKAEFDLSQEAPNEVIAALKSFGFSSSEISEALRNTGNGEQSAEIRIKEALKYLGK